MIEKVAIIKPKISVGGSSNLIFSLIELLNRYGIVPDVFSFESIDKDEIEKSFGKKVDYHLILCKYSVLERSGSYYTNFWLATLRKRLRQYDLCFNSSKFWAFCPKDVFCIHYINFPGFAWGRIYQQNNALRRLYWKPLEWVHTYTASSPNWLFIANSQYIKKVFEDLRAPKNEESMTAEVVYPPTDLKAFLVDINEVKNLNRAGVVSIGRFESNKRQLDQIRLAQRLPNLDFHIIGNIDSPQYYDQCKKLVKDLKVDNVCFYANVSFQEIVDKLKSSMYFLHTMHHEHFGISIVEAIAAGCIPIVHNSGGPREIVNSKNLRFNNLQEAEKIFGWLNLLSTIEKATIRDSLRIHINQFSDETFKSKLSNIIFREEVGE